MSDIFTKVNSIIDSKKIDAILVSDGYNMRYISGFTGATGYLIVTKTARFLFTDSRYTVAAKAQAPEFQVIEIDNALGYIPALNDVLNANSIKTLGFESNNFRYSTYLSFSEKLTATLIPLTDELTKLRVIKTEDEIAKLRQAEKIGDIGFEEILQYIKPGVTELEIAAKLEYIMKTNGAENLSFDTIIASGLNGAKPHAEPGNKKIEKGDFVTMDFGAIYQGYHSDMTRTVVVGKANDRQKEIYNLVLKAQCAVIDQLKAGMKGKEYDKIARDIIKDAGFGQYFGHGLGHSVGLEIHENPRFSVLEEEIIKPGTIITVEPGIYIPDFGGVRIEDMLVVLEDGYENLTHSRKDLIEL